MGCNSHRPPDYTNRTTTGGSNYPRSYGIPYTNAGEIVTLKIWTDVYNAINSERSRRGNGRIGYNINNPIAAGTINNFWNGISYY